MQISRVGFDIVPYCADHFLPYLKNYVTLSKANNHGVMILENIAINKKTRERLAASLFRNRFV
jgi:hypothetical protein